MSLKRTAENNLAWVFRQCADIVKVAEYKSLYDVDESEDYRRTPVYYHFTTKCLVMKYTQKELESAAGLIESTDQKVLIPLPLPEKIRVNGTLTIDETEYAIISVETDPTETLCFVQARGSA